MKINSNSWHSDLIWKMLHTRPQTLCSYFWSLMLSMLLFVSIGCGVLLCTGVIETVLLDPICTFAVMLMGHEPTITFFTYVFHAGGHHSSEPVVWYSFGLCMSYVAWGGLAVTLYKNALPEKYKFKFKTSSIPVPEKALTATNVTIEFLKARKRKICPLIEYVND